MAERSVRRSVLAMPTDAALRVSSDKSDSSSALAVVQLLAGVMSLQCAASSELFRWARSMVSGTQNQRFSPGMISDSTVS